MFVPGNRELERSDKCSFSIQWYSLLGKYGAKQKGAVVGFLASCFDFLEELSILGKNLPNSFWNLFTVRAELRILFAFM